uniref:Uncharacterized protein n=1 Tax=Wuchereria bancrofti TaxID=6293 RepID=A0AAF5PGW1_WUCBA
MASILDWSRTAVHDQPIPPLNKLTYLRGCFVGAAASVIEPYGLRTQNYEVVIAALKKRYEQPAAIKQALYRELERLPRAKGSNLRTTTEAIDRIVELLGFQEEDVNSTLIIYLIKQKLSKSIWEKIEYEKSEWTVPTLIDRLATFVIAEENVASILGYALKEPYSPHWDCMVSLGRYAVSPLPIQREPSVDSHSLDYLLNYWKEGVITADKFWEKWQMQYLQTLQLSISQNKQYQVVDPNIELEDEEKQSIHPQFGGRKTMPKS